MCISAAPAALIGAAATTAGVVVNAQNSRRAAKTAANAARESEAAARAADTKATQDANARIAMRRRALARNSLMTGGGAGGIESQMQTGRATLGGS